MKTYEKPMAIIEKINVEDVITASGETVTVQDAVKAQSNASDVIVFQW